MCALAGERVKHSILVKQRSLFAKVCPKPGSPELSQEHPFTPEREREREKKKEN